MHAIKLLQKCLLSALEPMHMRRRESLLGSVAALIDGRRLVLMDLARSWPGQERVAAPLKRVDRLLSNAHLADERESIYSAMGKWCLCQPQPVILVDWSPVNRRGKFYLLRAALAVGGRALTLWERVTPAKECNAPQHEQALLRALEQMMPIGSTPILVTDAGFKSPWFKAVTAMGWDFVGRLRGSVLELKSDTHFFTVPRAMSIAIPPLSRHLTCGSGAAVEGTQPACCRGAAEKCDRETLRADRPISRTRYAKQQSVAGLRQRPRRAHAAQPALAHGLGFFDQAIHFANSTTES